MSQRTDEVYRKIALTVLENGKVTENRTGTRALKYFGYSARFDFEEGFPILTTKQVNFRAIVHELIWFLSGSTDIHYLVKNGVNIWNDDAYRNYLNLFKDCGELLTKADWLARVKETESSISDLGYGTYGSMWRDYPSPVSGETVDQIAQVIAKLKADPLDRRLIVNAWNPALVNDVALPPCHVMFQLDAEPLGLREGYRLNLAMFQRSADLFLGVPFNISSYALLLALIAREVGMVPGDLIMHYGNVHIYENHLDQIKEQLARPAKECVPNLLIRSKDIFSLQADDIVLIDYNSHPPIKGKLSTGLVDLRGKIGD